MDWNQEWNPLVTIPKLTLHTGPPANLRWKTHSQLSLTQITRTALGPAWTATLLLRNHSTNSFQPGSGHPPSGTPRLNCSHSGWSSLNQLTMPPTELFHQSGRKMCSGRNTLLSPEVPCVLLCHAGRRRTTRSFSTLSAHFTHTQLRLSGTRDNRPSPHSRRWTNTSNNTVG